MSVASSPSTRRGLVWWLAPTGAALLVLPGSLYLAWAADDTRYRLAWRVPKLLTDSTVLLLLVAILLLVAGSLWPLAMARRQVLPGPWPALQPGARRLLVRAERVLFAGTMLGYAGLLLAGVSRGVTPAFAIQSLFGSGSSDDLKRAFSPIAGVTTFTQLGILQVVVACLLLAAGGARGVRPRLAVVIALATLRAFALSERLALLELALPAGAVAATALYTRGSRLTRGLVLTAPLVFAPAVVGLFAASERLRSWRFYSTHGYSSFSTFITDRFSGYYATSYNNGQLSLDAAPFPGRLPYDNLIALWSAPGVEQAHAYTRLSGQDASAVFQTALAQQANPEFNNPGGLAAAFVDFGHTGGLVYFLLVGSLLGLAYVAFLAGRLSGLLVYPVLLTGLLDLPRYVYWTQGRVLPAFLAAAVVLVLSRSRGRRQRERRASAALHGAPREALA
ncbi:hypothetical protein [Motilibacter deserti]|uniref:Oligosaccharide repeat unit polymerase n=1 Tax=Motilibacter deserti TaxID=2714956 RepID=A0ABX0GSE7_9ACTN|nr:hypothetical protein [Motilibacter deserti]NHC13420.1 oligosaccharide repeat unit polymerase [Motilibacter deserti]